MINIFNYIYKLFFASILMLVLSVLLYAYTTNIVLNHNIFTQQIDKTDQDSGDLGIGSNGFEEEVPTENFQTFNCFELDIIKEEIEPKICFYTFSYINDFEPEVISPPPNNFI